MPNCPTVWTRQNSDEMSRVWSVQGPKCPVTRRSTHWQSSHRVTCK